MPLNSTERSVIARQAALTRSASEVGSAISAPARRAFLDRFTKPPVPGETPEQAAERVRQGDAALRLHMTRLSNRAAAARRAGSRAMVAAADLEQVTAELAREAV